MPGCPASLSQTVSQFLFTTTISSLNRISWTMRSTRCSTIRSLYTIPLIVANIWRGCASEYRKENSLRSYGLEFCKGWRVSFQGRACLFEARQIPKTYRISAAPVFTQPFQTFEVNKRSLTQSKQSGHRFGT